MRKSLFLLCAILLTIGQSAFASISDELDYRYLYDGTRDDLTIADNCLIVALRCDRDSIQYYIEDKYGITLNGEVFESSFFTGYRMEGFDRIEYECDSIIRCSYSFDSSRFADLYDALRADEDVYSVQRAFVSSNRNFYASCRFAVEIEYNSEAYARMMCMADSLGAIPDPEYFDALAGPNHGWYCFISTTNTLVDAITCCALFYDSGIANSVSLFYAPANFVPVSYDLDTTSVDSLPTAIGTPSDSPRYDMSGRKITGPASGIYIQDGRKMLAPQK